MADTVHLIRISQDGKRESTWAVTAKVTDSISHLPVLHAPLGGWGISGSPFPPGVGALGQEIEAQGG